MLLPWFSSSYLFTDFNEKHLPEQRERTRLWNEVVPLTAELANATIASIKCDQEAKRASEAYQTFYSGICRDTGELVAGLRAGIAKACEVRRKIDVTAIALKINSMHSRVKELYESFDEHNFTHPEMMIVNELEKLVLQPSPLHWSEIVTDAELEGMVRVNRPVNKKDTLAAEKNRIWEEYDASKKAINARRPVLTPAQKLSISAGIFFNSCSISGHTDAMGRASSDKGISEFAGILKLTNADNSSQFKPFWYKPNALVEMSSFESAVTK